MIVRLSMRLGCFRSTEEFNAYGADAWISMGHVARC